MIPKILVKIDKHLDMKNIIGFSKENEPIIFESFPEFGEERGKKLYRSIPKIIGKIYKEEGKQIRKKVRFLQKETKKIEKLCLVIEKIVGENWKKKYKKITVFVGICPIAPRYLDQGSFFVPAYISDEESLCFCAHELIHFLYFYKWSKLFDDKPLTFEYPHPTWVLSEILAPIITADKRIQKITACSSKLYPHWQDYDKKFNLLKTFKKIYQSSSNFENFLKKSKEKYDELDKKHNLTRSLT